MSVTVRPFGDVYVCLYVCIRAEVPECVCMHVCMCFNYGFRFPDLEHWKEHHASDVSRIKQARAKRDVMPGCDKCWNLFGAWDVVVADVVMYRNQPVMYWKEVGATGKHYKFESLDLNVVFCEIENEQKAEPCATLQEWYMKTGCKIGKMAAKRKKDEER